MTNKALDLGGIQRAAGATFQDGDSVVDAAAIDLVAAFGAHFSPTACL